MIVWKLRAPNNHKDNNDNNNAQTLDGSFPEPIKQVLLARGVTQENLDNILNPKLGELKDPRTMKGMDAAVQRLVQAFRANEKVCIYADFDLDGTSGLAILKLGLEKIGFKNVYYYQPKRLAEGYGFHASAVEELKNLGVTLIVTVDVGITSFAAFVKAKEIGVDVILTDHHLPAEHLPDAYSIVNPNMADCSSGLGYLCGAGVAFYLLRALKRAFYDSGDLPKNEWDLKDVLEYFCIGTLTDMVPLVDDNRVLVRHGLKILSQTKKVGLRALLQALSLDKNELSSQDVAIRFAPKLNALSRMEYDVLPAQIYLEEDPKTAKAMVSKVLENNEVRQNLQQEAEQEALKMLSSWNEKNFVFVSSKFFHRGIIGLIATKLSQQFNCPAFVGSENSEGVIVGSARSPAGTEVSLVHAMGSAVGILNRFGGHAMAAGFELHKIKTDQFVESLKNYFRDRESTSYELEYDSLVELKDINTDLMKWHDSLGPFGVGFSIPVFQIQMIKINSVKELKGGHYKLSFLDENTDCKLDGLVFSPSEKLRTKIKANSKCDILTEIQWNYFNGKKSIQLLVKDLKLI